MKLDLKAVEAEVVEVLQDLIRFDTTNPPGNEILCANYLADRLRAEGVEPLVTESEPGRGNVTARLEGGDEPTLMLLGHTDVVAVEPEKWTHPPFSGKLVDGRVWGRGALDMKNMVAANFVIFLALKRSGVTLNRDVIFAATADEEAGKGNHGVGWLLDTHPEQVNAKYVLTEGGGSESEIGGARFYTCQTGQKGIFRFRLHAKGRPGHGSVPHDEIATVRLAEAVASLGRARQPIHPSPSVTAFIEGIASKQDDATAAKLRAILDPETSAAALADAPLPADLKRDLGSLLRNSISPTMLQAGTKINVIPAEATAWIDGRLAPGQTDASFLDEIRPHLGPDVEVIVDQYSPPVEASIESPLYSTIVEIMSEHDPGATVIPSVMTGGTDAKHILPRAPETQVYGFMPFRATPGESENDLIHGHDERTSVENLVFGTKVLYDVVTRFCAT